MSITTNSIIKPFTPTLMGVALSLSACTDFLDQTNETALTQEQVINDVELVETSVKSIYNNWKEN